MSGFVDDEIYIEELLADPRYACIEMLSRLEGATIDEIREPFGWERHTARGFLSRHLNHDGVAVTSAREGGVRRYRCAYSLEDMATE